MRLLCRGYMATIVVTSPLYGCRRPAVVFLQYPKLLFIHTKVGVEIGAEIGAKSGTKMGV